ncbi:MAG: M23 family metallopeptidase, partial [Chloroflexota bacterium]|nr:M23 family metallopeptidase [Chloroflexota bacterium]
GDTSGGCATREHLLTGTECPMIRCPPKWGNSKVFADNNWSYGAITGTVIDYSHWPSVNVKVENNHSFWQEVWINDAYGATNVIPTNTWASVGYLPPDGEATYTLVFDQEVNARVQVVANGAGWEAQKGPIAPALLTLLLRSIDGLSLAVGEGGLSRLSLITVKEFGFILDRISNLPDCMAAVDKLARNDIVGGSQSFYKCFTQDAEVKVIAEIAQKLGETSITTDAVEDYFNIWTALQAAMTVIDTFWAAITGSYAGWVVFNSFPGSSSTSSAPSSTLPSQPDPIQSNPIPTSSGGVPPQPVGGTYWLLWQAGSVWKISCGSGDASCRSMDEYNGYAVDAEFNRGSDLVTSVADGTVVNVQNGVADTALYYQPHAGNCVTIDHGGGIYSMYAHLAQGSVPVQPGQTIPHGTVIGRMGNSGYSSSKHLQWAVGTDPGFRASYGQAPETCSLKALPAVYGGSDAELAQDGGVPRTGRYYDRFNVGGGR